MRTFHHADAGKSRYRADGPRVFVRAGSAAPSGARLKATVEQARPGDLTDRRGGPARLTSKPVIQPMLAVRVFLPLSRQLLGPSARDLLRLDRSSVCRSCCKARGPSARATKPLPYLNARCGCHIQVKCNIHTNTNCSRVASCRKILALLTKRKKSWRFNSTCLQKPAENLMQEICMK